MDWPGTFLPCCASVFVLCFAGATVDTDISSSGKVTALSWFGRHDSSAALSIDGRIQCALEFERLADVRFHSLNSEDWTEMIKGQEIRPTWFVALKIFKSGCECEGGSCPSHLDYVAFVDIAKDKYPRKEIELLWTVGRYEMVDHHLAHAAIGFYSSTIKAPLIISYDGGSPHGCFHVYFGVDDRLIHAAEEERSHFGIAYRTVGESMSEVTGIPTSRLCDMKRSTEFDNFREDDTHYEREVDARSLGWPGKLMGYAALGEANASWDLTNLYHAYQEVCDKILDTMCNAPEAERLRLQRNLAWNVQAQFESDILVRVAKYLRTPNGTAADGIILTGGCALNVLANQHIFAKHADSSSGRRFFIPSAPHDGGLTVGAIWAVEPPKLRGQPLQYIGFRLWDLDTLERHAAGRQARKLSSLGGVDFLASLLAGKSDEVKEGVLPIIAIVRGRQEYGPRALGHRSLVAVPTTDSIRDRMNAVKARQWYRPVAPMLADEALVAAFGYEVPSPYMTMAPRVRPQVNKQFPALAHLDGTARVQSVGSADEAWVHSLLLAVGQITGLATLINTSFNTKGRPIVNKIKDCLAMLDEQEIDYLLIEDWLFSSNRRSKNEL